MIVKVGGSVITKKNKETCPKVSVIKSVSNQISQITDQLILIHGAGSYGHPIAAKYKLNEGYKGDYQWKGITELKMNLMELTNLFLSSLKEQGVKAYPINPSSFLLAKKGRIFRCFCNPLNHILQLGAVPLLHGDLVPDLEQGLSIISGDQLASYFANIFKPYMVIFGCDVDGLYTRDPKKYRSAHIIPHVKFGDSNSKSFYGETMAGIDVTGGITGKIKEAKRISLNGIPVTIVNLEEPNRLLKVVRQEDVICTLITSNKVRNTQEE